MNKVILLLFLCLLCHGAYSQSTPIPAKEVFPLGIIDEIQSVQLSEKRILNIYLPDGYNHDSADKYPVIYLLDGSANEDFIHIAGIVQFMNMLQMMQGMIVVGIANVDRRRDFTFPTMVAKDKKDYPTTGSSEKFMQFLEKELVPYVQKKYSNNASRTIIGQSLGGLLATEVLLKKPGLFTDYIIVSPSLWWDKESLLAKANKLIKIPGDKITRVYVSVGNEEKPMVDDAKKLVNILKQHENGHFKVFSAPLPAENHLTILHNSVYKAFQLLNVKK